LHRYSSPAKEPDTMIDAFDDYFISRFDVIDEVLS
jgi:hypothetical protein